MDGESKSFEDEKEMQNNCWILPKLMINDNLLIATESNEIENLKSTLSESVPDPIQLCRICKKPFEDPRILACLHTFCCKCIDQLTPYIPIAESGKSQPNRTRVHLSNRKRNLKTDQSSSLPQPSSIKLDLIETKSVLCPICDSEVDLQLANCLPINYIVQKQASSHHVQLLCDVCVYKSPVTSKCGECSHLLCTFCTEAHKRQRKTSHHKIVKIEDEGDDKEVDINKKFATLQCMHHPLEDLKLFCEDCLITVCCICADESHRNHSCRFVSDVCDSQIARFQDEMIRLQHYVDDLKKNIESLQPNAEKFECQVNRVIDEVNEFIDSYIRTLQHHKQNLLNEIDKVSRQKKEDLALNKIQLQQTVEDLETSFAFSNDLLRFGNDVEILSLLSTVMQRFGELKSINNNGKKCDDIVLLDKSQSVRVDGLTLRGSISSRSPPLFKFVVRGDGLLSAREGQWAEIFITCQDLHGNAVILDDNYIKVILTERDQSGRCIPVQITNYKNGLHKLNFYPTISGFFLLHISSFGEEIQGSPFIIPIKSKWKLHSGTFHCCSFCSSNGSKDAVCACNCTMPGGYKGCGHGHKNHPGHKHWSCCGKTIEYSECARKPSDFYTFTI